MACEHARVGQRRGVTLALQIEFGVHRFRDEKFELGNEGRNSLRATDWDAIEKIPQLAS